MSNLLSLALKSLRTQNKRFISQFRKEYMATKKPAAKKTAQPKQKLYKTTTTPKKTETKSSVFLMKNKTYDIIKKIVAILPLVTALYIALAQIWGWGFGKEIDGTITAIVAFLNGVLGVFMLASSSAYHKGD